MEPMISNHSLINTLHRKTSLLMENVFNKLNTDEITNNNAIYSRVIHRFIQTEHVAYQVYAPRQIFLPLPQEKWPARFKHLNKFYDAHLQWPKYSTYFYVNDILMPPSITEILYSGYALYKEELHPCSFFISMQMTEQILGTTSELLPEFFVIDPLAIRDGIQPECYIGIPIRRQYLEEWLLERNRKPLPIILEVEDQIKQLRSTAQ